MAAKTKSTHAYIALEPCGCMVGRCADRGDKITARWVRDWIADGLKVERVTVEEANSRKLGCPHGQMALI